MTATRRRRRLSAATAFTFLLLLSSALSQIAGSYSTKTEKRGKDAKSTAFNGQKRLGGPGSDPPSCRSKCGGCSPCKPVHVPVQPGLSTPLEYYPEAWRCKCGNKLFMP